MLTRAKSFECISSLGALEYYRPNVSGILFRFLTRGAHDTIIPNHHLYRARVISTSDEVESIVHGKIDIAELIAARKGLPVTTQRRFDVYPDVSKPI